MPQQLETPIYDIHQPWLTLDDWQKKYIETEGNCFLLCGRQSGKTAGAAIKFGKRAAENPKRIILMLAYTEKQAYNLFFKTMMYLKAVHPKALITKGPKKPTKHILHLKNGSIIMCYAAGLHGEGIRTYTVTDLVIDEAAPMAREVFIATTPMLSITGGSLDIISTPRGREGYFYDCSKREDFTKFYVNAEDCPRHTKEFLAIEEKSMGKVFYAQEYKAEFMHEIKQFFREELIKQACTLIERKEPEAAQLTPKDYFLGVDVARMGSDESTFEILDGTDRDRIQHIRSITTAKTMLTETAREVIRLNKLYNFNKIGVDSTGMGAGVLDILLETDEVKRKVVAIENWKKTLEHKTDNPQMRKSVKEELYNNLLTLMEQGKITLLDNEDVKQSLASVQFEYINEKLRLHGRNTHIVEGLIRAAQLAKKKDLNIYIF